MKARWVSHYPSPTLPLVAQTMIAKWGFGRYYLVSTVELDPNDPLHRLTESLNQEIPYEQVIPIKMFATAVSKCDKDGGLKSEILYSREYLSLSEAQDGHSEIVEQFSN